MTDLNSFRAVVIGSPHEDKTGEMLIKSLKDRGVDASWLSMDDLMTQMHLHGKSLLSIAQAHPYGFEIDVNEIVMDVESPVFGTDIAFLVSDRFPPFEHAVISTIDRCGVVLPNSPYAVLCAADKWRTDEVLRHAGLAVPRSRLVRSIEDGRRAAQKLIYPVVVKQLGGTHGKGVMLARDEAELETAISALGVDDRPLVLQQYIECDASDRRMVFVDGAFVGGFMRKAAPGEFRSNTALGGSVALCEFSDDQISFGEKVVRALGLKFAGLDIGIMTESLPGREYLDVGEPFCIEANATPGLYSFPETNGVDLSVEIVDHVLRQAALRERPVA